MNPDLDYLKSTNLPNVQTLGRGMYVMTGSGSIFWFTYLVVNIAHELPDWDIDLAISCQDPELFDLVFWQSRVDKCLAMRFLVPKNIVSVLMMSWLGHHTLCLQKYEQYTMDSPSRRSNGTTQLNLWTAVQDNGLSVHLRPKYTQLSVRLECMRVLLKIDNEYIQKMPHGSTFVAARQGVKTNEQHCLALSRLVIMQSSDPILLLSMRTTCSPASLCMHKNYLFLEDLAEIDPLGGKRGINQCIAPTSFCGGKTKTRIAATEKKRS